MADTCRIVFKLEPDGSMWSASCPAAVRGAHLHARGRSLAEARRNIREAAGLAEGDVCEEDIRLPPELRQAVRRYEKTRDELARLKAEQAEVARLLTASFSLRDAGELLGISQEGVRQLLKTG